MNFTGTGEPPSRKGQRTAEPRTTAPANGVQWAPRSGSSLLSARLLHPVLHIVGSPCPQATGPQEDHLSPRASRVDHVTAQLCREPHSPVSRSEIPSPRGDLAGLPWSGQLWRHGCTARTPLKEELLLLQGG